MHGGQGTRDVELKVGRADRRGGVEVEAPARDSTGGGWVDQTAGEDPVREGWSSRVARGG